MDGILVHPLFSQQLDVSLGDSTQIGNTRIAIIVSSSNIFQLLLLFLVLDDFKQSLGEFLVLLHLRLDVLSPNFNVEACFASHVVQTSDALAAIFLLQ